MRKLKLQMQTSVEGFVAGVNGEMDWLVRDWDDELSKTVQEITENIDLILLGRKLAEGFIPTWTSLAENPATAEDFARKMVETPKIVFSKTLTENNWKNTRIVSSESATEIANLKAQAGGDIIVYGGANFVSSLIKDRLIDEYNLFVNPSALGKGMTVFADLKSRLDLKLVKSCMFDCGITLLRYEPK